MKKFILIIFIAGIVSSCQFTETMTIDEDGKGRMAIEMDMSEMMAFTGEFDSIVVKEDSIISFRQVLEDKKDSIAQLPIAKQNELKALENYNLRMITDSEMGKMLFSIYIDFESVKEANDIFNGLGQTSSFIPGAKAEEPAEGGGNQDILGLFFKFEDGTFTRDAYIKDVEQHSIQMDSIDSAAAFLSSTMYNLKYTFPRKIKFSSIDDATFSMDGKTIEVSRSLIDYLKDPDILDLTVELEN